MDCRAFELSLERYELDHLPRRERAEFELHATTCASCARRFEAYSRSTCAWLADFLADYLDGDLGSEQVRVFEWHLAACAECRRYLHQYRVTIRVVRTATERELAIPPRLIAAVLSARRR